MPLPNILVIGDLRMTIERDPTNHKIRVWSDRPLSPAQRARTLKMLRGCGSTTINPDEVASFTVDYTPSNPTPTTSEALSASLRNRIQDAAAQALQSDEADGPWPIRLQHGTSRERVMAFDVDVTLEPRQYDDLYRLLCRHLCARDCGVFTPSINPVRYEVIATSDTPDDKRQRLAQDATNIIACYLVDNRLI